MMSRYAAVLHPECDDDLSAASVAFAWPKWQDEGLAAAMQGLTRFANPYHFHTEPARHDAWLDGFESFTR